MVTVTMVMEYCNNFTAVLYAWEAESLLVNLQFYYFLHPHRYRAQLEQKFALLVENLDSKRIHI